MTALRRPLRLRDLDAPTSGRRPLDLDAAARRWPRFDPGFLDMNPSVAVTAAGATWVAFCRYPVPPEPGRGSVWIVGTDRLLHPVGRPQLLVDDAIDPRLVADGDDLHMAFTTLERDPSTGAFTGSAMAVARFALRDQAWAATGAVRLPKAPAGGAADAQPGWEKNWVPWGLGGGRLGWLYAHEPWQVLTLDGGATPPVLTALPAGPGIAWDHGSVRGGTPPVPFDDNRLVTFFHSSQVVGGRMVYAVGACVMDAQPPFAPVGQTASPLFVAPYGRGAERFGWRFAGSVVFPGGAVRTADGFDLLCGLDDGEIAVVTLAEAALRERLGPPRPPRRAEARDEGGRTVTLRVDPAVLMPAGHPAAEPPLVALARHLAGDGRTFVDIGAGPGCFSIGLASIFTRVLAYEPSPALHGWLLRNIALNGCEGVAARRALPTRAGGLDGLDLADVDLVKLDAPGRELAVLAGAAATLRRSRPAVLVRVAPGLSQDAAIAGTLAEAGYDVRSVAPGWLIGVPPSPHPVREWLL